MLYKRGRLWWCKFKLRGQEIRRSTGETDRRRAASAERRIRTEAEETVPANRAGRVGLEELAAADIKESLAGGASAVTLRTKASQWKPVLMHFGYERDPATIDLEGVISYVAARRTAGVRGQTIRRELRLLKRALRIAKRRGHIARVLEEWPTIKSDPPKQGQRGKLHPPDVLRRVLERVPADVRDGLVFAMLTGVRYAELRRVAPGWVVPAPAGAPVPALLKMPAESTKTRKERVVGLPRLALEIMRRRIEANPERALVFPRVLYRRYLVEACEAIGYNQVVTLRDLRHTYATLTLQQTGDATAVQAALGHADLSTTQRYMSSTIERAASVGAAAALAMFNEPHEIGPKGAQIPGHSENQQETDLMLSGGLEWSLDGARYRSRTCDLRLRSQANRWIACAFCSFGAMQIAGIAWAAIARAAQDGGTPRFALSGGAA